MHSRSTPRMSTRPRARRALALVAGASAAALVLTACSGGSDGEGGGGGADDPIVVGISLPLTGDFSELHTSEVYAKNSQFGRRVAHGSRTILG